MLKQNFMVILWLKINQENLTSQSWSLRDISKIFSRIQNQKKFPDDHKTIETGINIQSISKEQMNKENVEKIIQLLKEIFMERVIEEIWWN